MSQKLVRFEASKKKVNFLKREIKALLAIFINVLFFNVCNQFYSGRTKEKKEKPGPTSRPLEVASQQRHSCQRAHMGPKEWGKECLREVEQGSRLFF
jgi:hypothetical protein